MKSIVRLPYNIALVSFSHPPPLPLVPRPHTVPNFTVCFSLLIFKLVFKGVSQCIPTMSILYFSLFNPFYYYSPLSFYLSFSTAFNTHPYILSLHILCYVLLLMLYHPLFLSLFPQILYGILCSSSTVTNMFYI
jgi:hypothetical protein